MERRLSPRVEEQKLRIADNAERFADTEDSIAETLDSMASTGRPENRRRRKALAQQARQLSDQERLEAEKWRSVHAQEVMEATTTER